MLLVKIISLRKVLFINYSEILQNVLRQTVLLKANLLTIFLGNHMGLRKCLNVSYVIGIQTVSKCFLNYHAELSQGF